MTDRLPSTLVRVHPVVRQDAERVWAMKSSGCKERDHYDIQPQVSFFDDKGDLIVSVVCDKGRDGALAAIRLGTAPMNAAIVVAHMDAHVTQSATNPVTGEKWGPGEMQGLCDNEGACATGLLTDCIASTAMFRDGHAEMLNRMYHGHEKAGGIHWVAPDHLVEDPKMDFIASGLVTDTMREAMADDTFKQIAAGLAAGFDPKPDDVTLHWLNVSMALKCMIGIGVIHAAIPNPPTEEMQKLTKDSLSEASVRAFLDGPLGTLFHLLAVKWGVA